MKKEILNEKGSVLLMSTAVIVILISTISAISLLGIVRFDNIQVRYANDILQQETLLRSERQRTGIIMQESPNSFPLSDHTISITSNGKTTKYKIDNQPVQNNGKERIGPTLITAERGNREFDFGGAEYGKKSPIKRYAESVLQGKSLAQYQYFTMHEYSENDEYGEDDPVKFWGEDELFGPVHSNDDIWLQYGGTPASWPVFHAMVTTNKIFKVYPTGEPAIGNVPIDEIFLGGYEENAGFINISAGDAKEIRANGYNLAESQNHDVLYVQIDGTNSLCRYADIITEPDTFTVYNSFPDAAHPNFTIGDSIWTNYINVKKLDWEDETFPLQIINSSVFVHCQLWIEGEVSGMQTWGCADTIFITGDLTYDGVNPGDPPDIYDSSMLGLVSEERIYIQYKMRDPVSGEIHDPNTNSIWLYGNFAAIGDGDEDLYGNENTHYEGIFSFYYQHPHGSTEGFTLELPNGTVWEVDYPDFHKFIFPPSPYWTGDPLFLLHGNQPIAGNNGFTTCGYPYETPTYGNPAVPPYGTDWPWYNPVWPEASNPGMGERGDIHMYGGVQQFRRGFVHRSGTDPLNHPNEIEWDIHNWHYDGTHGSTGYGKDYHWDDRIDYGMLPPDYPQVYEGLGSTTLYYSSSGWTMKVPPEN